MTRQQLEQHIRTILEERLEGLVHTEDLEALVEKMVAAALKWADHGRKPVASSSPPWGWGDKDSAA